MLYLMRYAALRSQLRAARKGRGLTQAGLAALSRTSRVTVARFEAGAAQDVRLGTLERMCEAVGLELTAGPRGRRGTVETLLARAEEGGRRLDRRRRHAALAVRLLAEPARSAPLIRRARQNVDRWDRERLCSRHYVSRWRRMLSGPTARVARALLRDDAWADALFQNSPWGFALPAAAP
jgi:transcriptional regulator with XRE-family HTH domain